MRKCLRCEAEMAEGFALKVQNKEVGIEIRKEELFEVPLGMLKCAACPQCGAVETYVEDASFAE